MARGYRRSETISVDGEVSFVTGLCVGRMWMGEPDRGLEPWRDTGLEVRGPSVADIEHGLAEIWKLAGEPLPPEEQVRREGRAPEGETALRVVASLPATAGLLRVDELVAALAKERLWLTDAYFAGTTAYIQALRAARKDGVDVRLLVPGGTDLPFLKPLSHAGYHPLLEAGVRVFEWKGTMLHAKTAVADGRWARVGSSNLNIASWLGDCEMDVIAEDEPFARLMEEMYLRDLENATEVVPARFSTGDINYTAATQCGRRRKKRAHTAGKQAKIDSSFGSGISRTPYIIYFRAPPFYGWQDNAATRICPRRSRRTYTNHP